MRLLDLSVYWGVTKVEEGKKSDQEAVDAVKVQRRGQAKVGVIGQRGCLGATQSREPTNDSTDFGLATSSAPDTKKHSEKMLQEQDERRNGMFCNSICRKEREKASKDCSVARIGERRFLESGAVAGKKRGSGCVRKSEPGWQQSLKKHGETKRGQHV